MAMMNAGYSATPYTDSQKAKREAERARNWQQMLQMAAVANKMNDRTALGFGLGALLANNWDKWFGGGKGKSGNNNGTTGGQYDFSLNMATAKDPLQFATAGGDPHAKWALENNQPFNLAAAVQNPVPITARPMLDNFTVNGVNPQVPASGNTIQSGIPLTQQLTIGGQNAGVVDPNKTMKDSNYNPVNWANIAKEMGATTSPWSSPKNYPLANIDFLNQKKYPWEVQ